MSLDLFKEGINERLSQFRPVTEPEPGFFEGGGMLTMRGFARSGRAIDIAGAVGPIVHDAITGGTERQDRYFREHDEIFTRAVEHWTPKPGEVGAAAEVVGGLVSLLPTVIASPALAVATTGLATAQELVEKGVSPEKSTAVGLTQAAGLGLGVWMPILGATGWQRIALGGAGFNVVQGVATRGVSGAILTDTPAAEDFKAFDPEMLTLDVLLGAAFGTLAHISPAQRAQGAAAWERIGKWGRTLDPSQVDAVAALRQAQHLNVDSVGGKPADLVDIEAHVTRMRTALDQFARGEPIQVEDLPAPRIEADGRFVAAGKQAQLIVREADAARKADDLPAPDDLAKAPEAPQPRAEPAGEAAKAPADPLTAAAERFVTDNADLLIRVGEDVRGEPVTVTPKKYLELARAEVEQARADMPLFQAAARCLFAGGV